MIDRDNFDIVWLEHYNNKRYANFNGFYLKEKDDIHEQVKIPLSDVIIDHHMHPDDLECLFELGYEDLAEGIDASLPKPDKVKTGNFGEVISSEHLCQRYGYEMPVFKLRYMDTPYMPMRGEDIIAFKIQNDDIKAICVGEAKTSANYNGSKVKEAHQKLLDIQNVRPISLTLIINILWDKNPDLARNIRKLLANLGFKDIPKHNWIFIITGNKPRDPFKPIGDMTLVASNLNMVSIFVRDIKNFIEEIYEMCYP